MPTHLPARAIGRLLAVAVCAALTGSLLADPADDQYAVAAGHYARAYWPSAIDEFRKFLEQFPEHAKNAQARFFLAEALLQDKKWDEARTAFRDFLLRDPKSGYATQARFRIGETAYLLGDTAEAYQALREFVEQSPGDKLIPQARAYLGEIELAETRFDEAAEHFLIAADKLPPGTQRDRCRFGLARCLEQQGKFQEAIAGYRELTARRDGPMADDAQLRRGVMAYRREKFADSGKLLADFDTHFAKSPLRPRAELVCGWSLYQREKFSEAEKRFASARADEALAVEAQYWEGRAILAQEKWKQAAEALQSAAEKAPGNALLPDIVYYLAVACDRSGQGEASQAAYRRVWNEFPESPWADDARLASIEALAESGHFSEVEAAATEFAARYPESPALRKIAHLQARHELAQEEFEAAARRLEPWVESSAPTVDGLSTRYLMAHAYQGLKRHADALEMLEPLAADKDHPLHAAARLLRGAALEALGRHEESLAAIQSYLKSPPSDADLPAAQALLAVAQLKMGKVDEAREALRKFTQSKPPVVLQVSTAQNLAEAAVVARQFAWAAELFQQVAEQTEFPDRVPAALAGMGWAHYQNGALPAALAAYDRLLEQYPRHELATESALTAARIHARREEFDPALVLYARVSQDASPSPAARDALWEAARIHDSFDQDARAEELLARLDRDYPDHLDHDAVLYQWSMVLRQLKQPARADELLARLRREHPRSRLVSDVTIRLAEAAVAADDRPRAAELLKELRAETLPAEIEPHVWWLEGKLAATEKRWEDCAKARQQLAQRFPESPLRLLADYHQAEARYRLQQWAEAGLLFDDLVQRTVSRDDEWVAMVHLRRAQLKAKAKDWAEAQRLATQVAEQFPDCPQRYEIDYLIGLALAMQARLTDAREYYEKVIASPRGGKTETAAMAQCMLAESYFHQRDYETALREYLRLEILYAFPVWQSSGLLQAAKCQENLQRWSEAAELYARVLREYPESSHREEAENRLRVVRERLARADAGDAAETESSSVQ